MYFIQLICLIAGVMNLIRYVILLSTGTLCNCVFFYFDTACLFDSWSDGSHKVRAIVMYGYIRYCAQKTLNFVVNGS